MEFTYELHPTTRGSYGFGDVVGRVRGPLGLVWRQLRWPLAVDARVYHALKPKLLPRVLESFRILAKDSDLVLVEGAGSPAEVNLRRGDIANMGFAEAADVPVVLVGDIERGGVIAAIVGTVALLEKSERRRLKKLAGKARSTKAAA